jgi:spoIIIJ-associated protein
VEASEPDPASRVRELLERVAAAAGVSARVEVHEDGETLTAAYVGDDLGLLIGRQGVTIDAIQHLSYRAAFRGEAARKRLVVDASGYREQRALALQADADRAVDVAVRDSRPVSLEPMSPLERKVVHEYLRDRAGIETYSEGEEPTRHLVVAPVVE